MATFDAGQTPTRPEARDVVAELWLGEFGDTNLDPQVTPDGQIVEIITSVLDLLWQGNGQLWMDSFFRSSEGTAVDRILDLYGIRRLEALSSRAVMTLYGTSLTNIPALTTLETAATGIRFQTTALAQIGDIAGSDLWVALVLTSEDSITYTITIDAVDHDYPAGVGESLTAIATGLRDAVNAGVKATAVLAGDDPAGQPVLVLTMIGGPFVVTVSDTGAGTNLDRAPAVDVDADTIETGPFQATAGTITTIVNPVTGLDGVINAADAVPGRNEETDQEFKVRHLRDLFGRGTANKDAVEARIRAVEVGGRLAALEAFVINDLALNEYRPILRLNPAVDQTDALQAIADTIWLHGPAGIESVGTTALTVIDTNGDPQPVGVTLATTLYLHLSITITAGEGFPTTGDPAAAARDAVAAYFGLGGPNELGIGDDFYRAQAFTPINLAVAGIQTIDIETDATPNPGDVPVFAGADVAVGDEETLDVDATRIAVAIAP